MNKVNIYLNQAKAFLGKFQKKEKKKGNPKPKQVSKRSVNISILTGVVVITGLTLLSSLRAITLYSRVTGLQKTITKVKQEKAQLPTQSQNIDKSLEIYLTNYVRTYFTLAGDAEKQAQQLDYLNTYYKTVPDIKAQGQTRNPTELKYYQLIKVEHNVAIFRVGYQETIKRDGKDQVQSFDTGFNIPYGTDKDKYYIAGLPWFSAIESKQANPADDSEKLDLSLTDTFSNNEKKKLTKFLEVFFTNYTTNQDNLNLIADNVSVVPNTEYKSIDFTYFKKGQGDTIIAYVQATFKVGETTHAENFTFTIKKQSGSYVVAHLDHTIPKDYADNQENERN
ncbi:conjugal transfer protein [Streptococcus dysgalactiae subsp. equisimilis]|uniref:conjugal transfer protein n=1 Tax=Streptococcus dysgalactiae TaxID=1334 RepID=UPI0003B0C78E|nr:conjugal transfer protein [Streptococcus dysgalactiae]BAN92710.1 putative transposon protein [Streptococcus dysgalactiae subsp. equisimilis 167]MCY7196071.1 conjugal transfer protein [Streptococcus dysgalactiae]MCY7200542.1 conjugal transfer protein [Streptococcus dysgalactiae]MCY7205573.1 conjugal transfer protein [Streptococcus dysgalactiae]MCY7216218.1 conjugal transfer protein [Streptococcus dysgalactiae]